MNRLRDHLIRNFLSLGGLYQPYTAFFLGDFQECITHNVAYSDQILSNTQRLLEVGKSLNMPLFVTELNPKVLGKTHFDLDVCHATAIHAKYSISMVNCETSTFIDKLCNYQLCSVILCGLETHSCVELTAIDLINNDIKVHVVADCTSSRSQEDRILSLKRLCKIGCFISTTENIIYKLIKDISNEQFQKIIDKMEFISQPSSLVYNDSFGDDNNK